MNSVSHSSVSSLGSSHNAFVDDLEAERLARLADVAADALPLLRQAIDAIVRSSYEEPVRARVQARRLIARVLDDLIRVAQGLAKPVPAYRKNAQPPSHVVLSRQRDAVWVEALRTSSLPALVGRSL